MYLIKNWEEIESEIKEIKKSFELLKPIVKKTPGVLPAENLPEFHNTMHRIDKIIYAFERITYALNLLESNKDFSRAAKNIETKLSRHFKEITNMRKDLEELFFGQP
jgi:hypothetical protein